jgi:hypothetical protein
MAYWINAYNILAAKAVVEAYPIESITKIEGVWDKKVGSAAGREVSLNEVEHQILRPMGDPRVHAAIVCASVSCPDLRAEAFAAERLETQLDEQMKAFLANPAKGASLRRDGTLEMSKIFEWFAEDFEKDGGALEFARPHLPWRVAKRAAPGTPIAFKEYDWALNDVQQ